MVEVSVPLVDVERARRAILKYQGGPGKFIGLAVTHALFSLVLAEGSL